MMDDAQIGQNYGSRGKWFISLGLICWLPLAGCTWVKLEAEADAVVVAAAEAVTDCERLRSTRVSVLDHVGVLKRKQSKVARELETLARNNALEFGGDTVVAAGPVAAGEQSFIIYRCRAQE